MLPNNQGKLRTQIAIIEREMNSDEFDHMNVGFDQNTIANGVEIQNSDRFTFVALANEKFIGCASGLAYKNGDTYNGWFYLTDLFLEQAYRSQRIGTQLLQTLEQRLLPIGINKMWTWTAGYEAPEFYMKQGYEIFAEMDNWYSNGDSRIGLQKQLTQ